MQALLIRKDQIEYYRTRAVVQAMVNKEAADEALKNYRDAQMPYLVGIQKTDRSQHIQRLISEVARGPMAITPVMQKQVRSKLKARVVQRTDEERVEFDRKLAKRIGGFL